jgi:hypothetical protein
MPETTTKYRPLKDISPAPRDGDDPAHPADVSEAVALLQHNVLKRDFFKAAGYEHTGDPAIYGPTKMAAVREAKYWAGYKTTQITGDFGPQLRAVLAGDRHLDAGQAKRRKERIAESQKPIGLTALAIAVSELGTKESPPGSNTVKYNTWWYGRRVSGAAYPWCAAAVSSWFFRALPLWRKITHRIFRNTFPFAAGARYVSCEAMYQDALAGRYNLLALPRPVPGCIVVYDWDVPRPGRWADHTGIVESVTADGIVAIEGNTSSTDQSNGGNVERRTRPMSQCRGFILVRP